MTLSEVVTMNAGHVSAMVNASPERVRVIVEAGGMAAYEGLAAYHQELLSAEDAAHDEHLCRKYRLHEIERLANAHGV